MINWFNQQGIEAQLTAPYSPSQNGAAERLNRTLVELARAMMAARNVPEFLWEHAIQHAAYLRERAPTKALKGKTPHKHGFNKNQMYLTYENLEHQFGYFYKAKRYHRK